MKIFLIYVDVDSYHKDEYHFGLGYLSSFLKKNNYEVHYGCLASYSQLQDLLDRVTNISPDIIGFTSVESQFNHVERVSRFLREKFRGLMVCGGVYVTIFPEAIKDAAAIDGAVIGEGEEAFLSFLKNLEAGRDFRKSPNFCYYDRENNELVRNPLLPLIEDLDLLPFPDRKIIDYGRYLRKSVSLPFLFNRGCPFNCTYCSNHALARVYGKSANATRFRSADNCFEEIGEVLAAHNTNKPLEFVDDLFTLNRQWLYGFLEKYKKNFRRPFICCTRSNLADEELFAKLREAGCFRVMMSIESGNEFIRNKVMKRNITQEQLLGSFRLARKYGLETSGVAMIGLPFETKEMVWDTIKVIADTGATDFTLNVFYPYKGTELYDVCSKNGFLPKARVEPKERREPILDLPTLSKKEILFFRRNCGRLVMRYRPFADRLRFYIKKYLGLILGKTPVLDYLKNTKIYINMRRLLYNFR
jgi:radical SAM superfamily enzyme YgiQ (UPF0313 family)